MGTRGGRHLAVSTVIDPGWAATEIVTVGYQCGGGRMPRLMIVFDDHEIGQDLFTRWYDRYGSCDSENEIRVCILTGYPSSQDHGYLIGISQNLEVTAKKFNRALRAKGTHDVGPEIAADDIVFGGVWKGMRLERRSEYQEQFIRHYRHSGEYLLSAALVADARPIPTDPAIRKTELIVRKLRDVRATDDPDSPAVDYVNRVLLRE